MHIHIAHFNIVLSLGSNLMYAFGLRNGLESPYLWTKKIFTPASNKSRFFCFNGLRLLCMIHRHCFHLCVVWSSLNSLWPAIGSKITLKGDRFESVPEMSKKTMGLLRQLTSEDLLHHFVQWNTGMPRYEVAKGNTLKRKVRFLYKHRIAKSVLSFNSDTSYT